MATPEPKPPFVKLSLSSPVLKGDNVREAQKALKTNRFGNFHPGKTDGHYGDHTAAAARRAKFWLGYPKRKWKGPERFNYTKKLHAQLTGDRKLGVVQRRRRTHRLNQFEKTNVGLDALKVAQTQVGQKESPADSNLQKFGKWYGANGVPWCAIFVSWCFGHSQPFYRWKKPHFKYAFCPFVVGDARAGRNGLSVVSRSGVRPGDLVLYDWPGESPGTADHIGFFAGWIDETRGTFNTVEGNTSLSNQSNGGEVMRRQRDMSVVQVFVRVVPI